MRTEYYRRDRDQLVFDASAIFCDLANCLDELSPALEEDRVEDLFLVLEIVIDESVSDPARLAMSEIRVSW